MTDFTALGIKHRLFAQGAYRRATSSKDPVYVDYTEYIERNGLFSWLGRGLPIFKFKQHCLFNLK